MKRDHLDADELEPSDEAVLDQPANQFHGAARQRRHRQRQSIEDLRAKREQTEQAACLNNYMAEAAANPNPMEANLHLGNATLMAMSAYLADVIEDNAINKGRSLETFKAVQPVIESQIKVTKEIEKMSRFLCRNENDRPPRW
jgi:hypothetical protein